MEYRVKKFYHPYIQSSKGGEGEKGAEVICEDLMAKNFPEHKKTIIYTFNKHNISQRVYMKRNSLLHTPQWK